MEEAFLSAILKAVLKDPSSVPMGMLTIVYVLGRVGPFAWRRYNGHNGTATVSGAIDHLTVDFKDYKQDSAERTATMLQMQNEQNTTMHKLASDVKVISYQHESDHERLVETRQMVVDMNRKIDAHIASVHTR